MRYSLAQPPRHASTTRSAPLTATPTSKNGSATIHAALRVQRVRVVAIAPDVTSTRGGGV